jgi:hypothetical protein
MASKEVTIREWNCDGCGGTIRSDTKSRDLPAGWTGVTTTIQGGLYTKGLDLCRACSEDPEAAVQRWKSSTGQ